MAERTKWVVAWGVLAGCSPAAEQIAIELPLTRPGIFAATLGGRVEAWAVDPARPAATLDPIEDWDGAPIVLAAVEADLASVALRLGPIPTPPAGAPVRTLAESLRGTAGPRVRRLDGDTDTGWTSASEIPEIIGRLTVPEASPCDGTRVHVVRSPTPRLSFSDVAAIPPRPGTDIGRAVVGAAWQDGRLVGGSLGVVTSTDTQPSLSPLEWPDLRPENLTWDGRQTVWGTLLRAFTLEQTVVQIGLDGVIRHRQLMPRNDDLALRFAFTHEGKVIAYSPAHVFELTTGSTTSVDRTADYPPGLIGLVEPSADRRLAIDDQHVVWRHRQGAWSVETRALPLVDNLYVFAGRVYALSESMAYARDELTGEWRPLADPYPTINKISLAGARADQLVMSGGAGLIAVYAEGRGWCSVVVGNTRFVQGLEILGDHGVAFENEGEEVTVYPSILFWLEIPR